MVQTMVRARAGWRLRGHTARSHPSLTLDVLGVVNDKVPIPDHRQVDGQVTDVIPLVEILQEKTEGGRAC